MSEDHRTALVVGKHKALQLVRSGQDLQQMGCSRLLAAATCLIVACGSPSATGSGGNGGTGGGGGVECQPSFSSTALYGEDEVREFLVGRWLLCDGAMMPAGAGLEVDGRGAWHFLVQAGDGSYAPDWTKAGNEIGIFSVSQGWQVTFYRPDGMEHLSVAAFYDESPRHLHLKFSGWDTEVEGWYVHAE